MRWLTVRVPDAARLPQIVREQLPTLVPFEAERAQVQFSLRQRHRVNEELECTLSLAACERTSLYQELEALWRIGWVPSEVMPAALALLQTAKALKVIGRESVVLMDIDEQHTTIVLVDQEEVVYARDVILGDDHFTEALMGHVSVGERTLSLSREQATALKQELGVPDLSSGPTVQATTPSAAAIAAHPIVPVSTYLAMIQPILEQLVSEVRRTITFGAHAAMTAGPTRLLISGMGSRMPHFDEWLSKQLDVPVGWLRCDSLLGSEGSFAAVSYGLTLSQRSSPLNLQPIEWRRRWNLTRAASLSWKALMTAVLIIWLASVVWVIRWTALTRQLGELEAERKDFQSVAELDAAIETRTKFVQGFIGHGVSVDWLRHLARGFPNPVRLTHLSIEAASNVNMTGEAQGREQTPEAYVSEFTLWLERAKICHTVQLGSTHRIGSSGDLLEFTLACQRP